jgi:endo-alpha-1,4-polygalactosaminidase (GH114 family)
MKNEEQNIEKQEGNALYTVLCAEHEYKTKFKEGDRVEANGYCGVLVLDSVDEFLTKILKKLHWNTISEDYLQGKSKINNGESYSDDEIKPCT